MKRLRFVAGLAALAALVGVGLFQGGDVSAASLSSTVLLRVKADLTNTAGLANAAAPVLLERSLTWTNGVGANQANVVWTAERTLAASATEDLDFAGGGLTDAFGAAVAPAKIRAVIVSASAGDTNSVVLGGDANSVPFLSAAATTVSIQPGGVFVFTAPAVAGVPVTAGTGDIIQVANSGAGTPVTYSIIVLGTAS
ncbi:MAG: hypothetical protein QUU85_10650 [Candidatus Eisenbacteria bacterium]|nr:hypothetical protein [Candidatus Eisenbacteria bacterium]